MRPTENLQRKQRNSINSARIFHMREHEVCKSIQMPKLEDVRFEERRSLK